jgi:MFS family permease
MLIIGAATFPINGSAYYVSSKYRVDWYLLLGRAIYGFGFGFWYVAEAAMVLSYPEEGRRGKYLGKFASTCYAAFCSLPVLVTMRGALLMYRYVGRIA